MDLSIEVNAGGWGVIPIGGCPKGVPIPGFGYSQEPLLKYKKGKGNRFVRGPKKANVRVRKKQENFLVYCYLFTFTIPVQNISPLMLTLPKERFTW